jgi:hypothetical protein
MNTPAQAELGRGTLEVCGRRLGRATGPGEGSTRMEQWSVAGRLSSAKGVVRRRQDPSRDDACDPTLPHRTREGWGTRRQACRALLGRVGFVFTEQPERLGKISGPMVSWNPTLTSQRTRR